MKLSQITSIIAALASLLPAISQSIQAAETALGPGNGAAKLAVVQSTVQAAYSTLQGVEVAWESLQPVVAQTITSLVTFYNTVKTFGHAGAPAAGG
jgi:hypothetical protein